MMDLKEFERQVLAGEITDFEPYFKGQWGHDQREQRYVLAKNGIETDRVTLMDGYNTIVNIINEGLLPERYEEWKRYPRAGVRQALVDNGYFWDYFINDEDPYIRQSIIEKDLRLGLKRLDNDEDRQVVQTRLLQKTNDELELDILKAYIKAEKEYGGSEENLVYQALALKYEALTATPSTIEKTMSPYQLYASNSPLRAIELDALSIESILDIEKNKGKLSKTMFNRIYEYQTQGQYCFDIETGDSITILKKGT